jgi:shikimate dehydrogenase
MIDGTTKLLGVLGWPVEHSMSPVLQNAALQAMGIEACYMPLPCPSESLGAVIAGLRGLGFVGANVTLPHKEAVIQHLDNLSDESRFTGSVNTLYWDGDQLTGTTTDATGAVLNLEANGVSLVGKRVALLGTGGAARALGFVLARGDCMGLTGQRLKFSISQLTILGRNGAKAAELAAQIALGTSSAVRIDAALLDDFAARNRDVDLVINCTSVGMEPDAYRCPIDPDHLTRQQIVYDIVYKPRETVLLREARRRGCVTVEGIGMLVYQGAASFQYWFDGAPDVAVMFDALKRYGY